MKGFIPLIGFAVAAVLGAGLAIAFLIAFKIKITNVIIFEHKTDAFGYSTNAFFANKNSIYPNMELMGSYLTIGNNAQNPSQVNNFNNYFTTSMNEIYKGQKCISYLSRNNQLRIENIGDSCLISGNNLIQVVVPIPLPYNSGSKIKIVSVVTNK